MAETNDQELSPKVRECLESIAKKEGYITYTITREIDDSGGQGYQAVAFPVTIKGKTAEGDKETHIYVKQAFRTEFMELYSYSVDFYRVESFFYSDYGKLLEKLQNDAKIPAEDRFNIVKGYDESNLDSTYMENVLKRGYRPCNRMELATLPFLELSLNQLAKFHGLSYVIKKTMPDYWKEKISGLKYPLKLNDVWAAVMTNASYLFCQDLTEETKKRAEAFIPKVIKNYMLYTAEDTPYNCLCHGDYRMMNIMKKVENGEVVDVIAVDYQNFCPGCPLNDFFYLICGCTDREMRKKNLHYLKDYYYKSLDDYLKYFNFTAEEFFPRKAFEETFVKKLDFALSYAMIFYAFFFAPPDNMPDWSKESLLHVKYTLGKDIQKRIQDMVDEYIELGIL